MLNGVFLSKLQTIVNNRLDDFELFRKEVMNYGSS